LYQWRNLRYFGAQETEAHYWQLKKEKFVAIGYIWLIQQNLVHEIFYELLDLEGFKTVTESNQLSLDVIHVGAVPLDISQIT